MRDIALTLLVFGSLPFILRRPFIGVLVWSWLSYMNPHRLTWGFAFDMPFAQIVAITLLFSLLFSREKLKIPFNGTIVIWILFILWMLITSIFAIYPDYAMDQFIKVSKIQIVTFLTLMLMTTQQRIHQLIWVIAVSIGYFSGKGGLFTILTGGSSRVWGPPGGFIQENNSLAMATLMIIPLIIYLYQVHRKQKWIALGLATVGVLSLVSVLGSQSRGALVSIIAVSGFLWLKTKSKLLSGIVMVLLGLILVSFMPQSWHDRMDTISSYQEDASAMGRINAWTYSINVASARLTGAGFESWSVENFTRWAPNPADVHAAHSIYFGVLGDHGWPGLIMFLLILFFTWRTLSKTIRRTNSKPEYSHQNLLARMLQVSMIAYMSGGAFLSLSYFDLPWHVIAIALLLAQQLDSADDVHAHANRRAKPDGSRNDTLDNLRSPISKP
jgi:probable O-glycosylation ligase (exosortase A-associated)